MRFALLRDRRFLQTFRHVGSLQRVDQSVEIAVNHAIEVMKREFDAVVGHAVLREIVGANVFVSLAGADLAVALGAVFFGFLALFSLQQPRT